MMGAMGSRTPTPTVDAGYGGGYGAWNPQYSAPYYVDPLTRPYSPKQPYEPQAAAPYRMDQQYGGAFVPPMAHNYFGPDQHAMPPYAEPVKPDDYSVTHGGTTYFYDSGQVVPVQSQVVYNPYSVNLPHLSHQNPAKRNLHTLFMSEDIRQDFIAKSVMTLSRLDPDDPRTGTVPGTVGKYHSLYPLDDPTRDKAISIFGFETTAYKATNSVDGMCYLLRKIEGFRPSLDQLQQIRNFQYSWTQVYHPHIVSLRDTVCLNSKDLYLVYDYYPCSETMEARIQRLEQGSFLPEALMWSFVVQIVSALRAIHSSQLAYRTLVPSKIIFTSKNRLRLNGVGTIDMLQTMKPDMGSMHKEDLIQLGKLILQLSSRSVSPVDDLPSALDKLRKSYSPALHSLVSSLLTNSVPYPSIDEISSSIAPFILHELEHTSNYNDYMTGEFSKEVENGRLFRLISKLSFINERPEFQADYRWNETGDRYVLRLFRDFIFHQVADDGSPLVDLGHVVECLNKLDAGVNEKIVLVSRDERFAFVVSYKDLKLQIESIFQELLSSLSPSNPQDLSLYGHI
eukprot:TRINITY_DN822_c0_g1_i1.p1 TRINITY_DN822_c0_g1~~TRINITY_DN822_c0_g1_i1.p1  ORF type:complete len:566 (+),score=168.43 TRINITY_DN822_c0_g1_i1:501-2198(+)